MKKWILHIALLIVTIIVGYKVLGGDRGLFQQYFTQKKISELKLNIDSLESELKLKKTEIERLKADTLYLEFIARTQMGMAKPNEKVLQFMEDSSSGKHNEP